MEDLIHDYGVLRCNICNACTCPPSEEALISFLDDSNPFKPISDDDCAWLSRFFIFGEHFLEAEHAPSASSETIYFATGLCRKRRNGIHIQKSKILSELIGQGYRIIPGEASDENIVTSQRTVYELIAKGRLRGGHDHLVVHQSCYQGIFQRILKRHSNQSSVNMPHDSQSAIGTLFECIRESKKKQCNYLCDSPQRVTRAMYKRRNEFQQDKAWRTERRDFLCDPCSSDWFSGAMASWPINPKASTSSKTPLLAALTPDSSVIKANPFDDLPIDIAMMIASYLTSREALFLSLASPATSHKLDLAKFWKVKARRDMPWFWEFDAENAKEMLNWRKVYFDLRDTTVWGSGNMRLGLINRKTIWKTCELLVDRYVEMRTEKKAKEAQQELAEQAKGD